MLSPLEKLNQALRENRPQDFLSTLHRELGLVGPEAAERPTHRVVRPRRDRLHVDRRQVVRPARVPGGPLEHLHADRRVRSRVDELLGSAIGSVLDDGELATTVELKISFLKPVAKGLVRGEGKVLRKGKRVAFVEATLKNAQDEVVATVSSTWTVVSAGSARTGEP